MVKDRLAELRANHERFCKMEEIEVDDHSEPQYSSSEIQLDICLVKVTQASKQITAVSDDLQRMKGLQRDIISNPLIDHRDVVKLEQSSDKIFDEAAKIQKEINQYWNEVCEMGMHDTHEKLIKNHLNKLQCDLSKVRNEYKAAQVEFIEKTQKLHQREYDIMARHDDDDPDDPNKIHTPLPAEFLGDYFAEAEKVKTELRSIQARDTKIKKIEESVKEVNQLFKEINALLMEQGEKLDTIENCVENTVNYVEEGDLRLKQARKYKDLAKRRKLYIVGFIAAILIMIVIIVAIVLS